MTKKLKGYGTFDVVLIVILVIVSFACVYPFWYVFANSFASYNVASRGAVAWWPSELSLDGYHAVFENKYLVSGFTVTVLRTIVATSAHVLFTSFVSYAMSRPNLIGKKIYMKIAMITMFFNGGLIPNFILMNKLHLYNTFWVFVLPGMFTFYNMIILLVSSKQSPKAYWKVRVWTVPASLGSTGRYCCPTAKPYWQRSVCIPLCTTGTITIWASFTSAIKPCSRCKRSYTSCWPKRR